MEKLDLFKALLNKSFFEENTHRLTKELFPEELWDVYEALEETHRVHSDDKPVVSLREVFAMYLRMHPSLSEAKKNAVKDIFKQVNEIEALSDSIAVDVFNKAMAELKATKIAAAALEIANGSHEDWDKLRKILDEDVVKEDIEFVTTVVKDLQDNITSTYKWRFNLAGLDDVVGPIGPEVFCVLAGPVNSGKTAMGISFVYGPGGFLEQGARVLHIGNEENMTRTLMRGVSAYTGFTAEQLKEPANEARAQEMFDRIRHNTFPINAVGMDFARLNHITNKVKPDIILLDMLDKVRTKGKFNRSDEVLGNIYEHARELGKIHKCAVLGVSQTSAESFGKLYYGFDKLAGSRVEKAANADLILLLGKLMTEFDGQGDSPHRVINIAKAKSAANGKIITCSIQTDLSRIVH